MPQQQVTTASY